VVGDGEQDSLAPHSLETGREFNFADGKGVTQVEAAVHVGVGKSAEPLGVLFLHILHGLIGLEELGVRADTLGKRWRVRVEQVVLLPVCLYILFDLY
jgi:hypothetical protein